ncbi:MAG: hypothetical protein AB7S26_15610 [Sandaracinaceae bacterium]
MIVLRAKSRAVFATLFATGMALLFAACGSSHSGDGGVTGFGAACSGDMSCPPGLACVTDPRFPDGYCTQTCSGECPPGAICVDRTAPALCLAECSAAADCRSGYQCWRGACEPLCNVDADCGLGGACRGDHFCAGAMCTTSAECGPGQVCRASQCVEGVGDGGLLLGPGSPCTAHGECQSGVCLPEALGGICTIRCTRGSECAGFGFEPSCSAPLLDMNGDGTVDAAPQVCVSGPMDSLGLGQICTSDDGCSGRLCQEGQCTFVCASDDECLLGQSCVSLARQGLAGATYMGCGWPPVGTGSVTTLELGEAIVDPGGFERLDIAVPWDAVSITLEAEDLDAPAAPGVTPHDIAFFEVVDPNGVRIFDLAQIAMLVPQPIQWLPSDTSESATMLIPNSTPDRIQFVRALHTFNLGAFPNFTGDAMPVRLRVVARIKRAPGGVLNAGRISLNVHILPGVDAGLNAATAPSNSRLQAGLSRLGTIYAEAGIAIDQVRYADLPNDAALQVIDSTDGPDSELSALFRYGGSTLGGQAVDVFLVRAVNGGGGGGATLGVAGGIPGPAEIHGSRHSGVVIAWNTIGGGSSGQQVLGHVLAHEIGHYLGLFHVTERVPPCAAGQTMGCAPFGGGDQLADTTLGDTTNLMHWVVQGAGSNTRLSMGQRFVLRAAALVRP